MGGGGIAENAEMVGLHKYPGYAGVTIDVERKVRRSTPAAAAAAAVSCSS